MTEFTTNLHFSLVDFNVSTWHDEVNDNFRSLDAILGAFTGITGLLGPWQNSTLYTVGQRVIDTDLDLLFEVAIQHTSAAAGTFQADRTAHPTFWTLISAAIPNPYAVPGNFSVAGNTTLAGTLAAGNTTITGTLGVSGLSTLVGLTATGAVTLSPANQPVVLSPTGTGVVTINPNTVGSINKVNIGATTPGTGAFTSLARTSGSMIVRATEVATTSGTVVDILSVPSWVERINLQFQAFSTNGASIPLIQIGDSGGIEIAGYNGSSVILTNAAAVQAANFVGTGFAFGTGWAGTVIVSGALTLQRMRADSRIWSINGLLGREDVLGAHIVAGYKTLTAALDRVRLVATNGTDAFDSGIMTYSWE